jgi:hypothetical protein
MYGAAYREAHVLQTALVHPAEVSYMWQIRFKLILVPTIFLFTRGCDPALLFIGWYFGNADCHVCDVIILSMNASQGLWNAIIPMHNFMVAKMTQQPNTRAKYSIQSSTSNEPQRCTESSAQFSQQTARSSSSKEDRSGASPATPTSTVFLASSSPAVVSTLRGPLCSM